MIKYCLLVLLAVAPGFAQAPQDAAAENAAENKELIAELSAVNNSSVDVVRVLEAFLKKHPDSPQRANIEKALTRAAIDLKDDRRIVLYGVPTLKVMSDDMLVLDRVAHSLLTLGGKENAQASLQYSRAFADKIEKAPTVQGAGAAASQEERDRGLSRALLYQSQAETTLGDKEQAEQLASRSFSTYPSEDPAREWAETLEALGRDKDAVEKLADAFAVPDSHTTDSLRAADRLRLGEMYRKLHHSEKGLGDLILAAYDRTSALVDQRRDRLEAMDPNSAATDPLQFTLSALDGSKFKLASLKGDVVVLDFWATWCQPCRAQHPLYDQVKKRFENRSDVVFLSVDADQDRSLVSPFLDQQKWSRNVFFEDGLQRFLKVDSIPTTILFDKNGRVASRMNGYLPDKFVDQLTERIKSALGD